MKKLTDSEQAAKDLRERFISAFNAKMLREEKLKYHIIGDVAGEICRTTRTIEGWLSRSWPMPKDVLVVRAVENWCEKEEEI